MRCFLFHFVYRAVYNLLYLISAALRLDSNKFSFRRLKTCCNEILSQKYLHTYHRVGGISSRLLSMSEREIDDKALAKEVAHFQAFHGLNQTG